MRTTASLWVAVAMAVAIGFGGAPPMAEAGVVKLATLVPDGSVWDKALRRMGAEWQKASDGRVNLRVYPGGVAGDEPDVLRKMRIGQLDAASITVAGLGEIDPAFNVLSIPLFYDSYDELFFVMERLEPLFEERLRSAGFEMLSWGHAGWVHLFSKRQVIDPGDLKPLKIFVWAGDEGMSRWWKQNGYRPVPLAATDILTGLETGMIDVYPSTPLAALSLQWFRQTPYMHGLGIAPLVGATVFTARGWGRIDERDRPALRRAADELEATLVEEIPRQDAASVEEMSRRGLTVVREYDEAAWRSAADDFARSMVEIRVPDEVYRRALEARDEYRRQKAGAGD